MIRDDYENYDVFEHFQDGHQNTCFRKKICWKHIHLDNWHTYGKKTTFNSIFTRKAGMITQGFPLQPLGL
jgi:hypothetical protein